MSRSVSEHRALDWGALVAVGATMVIGGLSLAEGLAGPGYVLLLGVIALAGTTLGDRGAVIAAGVALLLLAWATTHPPGQADPRLLLAAEVATLWYIVGLAMLSRWRQRRALTRENQWRQDRGAAAELAERSEALAQRLMDGLPTGLLAVDAERSITRTNPTAIALLHGSPNAESTLRALVAAGEGQIDLQVGGRWVDARSVPYSAGILVALQDITTRKRADADVERALALAQEAEAAQTRFWRAMSHEVRTPLTAVVGYTELLLENATPAERDDLDRILTTGRHVRDLVDDILDLGDVVGGAYPIEREPIQLAELFGSLARAGRPIVARRGNTLVTGLVPDVLLQTDPRRVTQIVVNLFSNATRATRDGTITLTVEAGPEEVVISVRDQGPGLSPEELALLFAPFQRVQEIDSLQGSGLGMPLARRLAVALGGRLEAESQPGEGSVFHLNLPIGVP